MSGPALTFRAAVSRPATPAMSLETIQAGPLRADEVLVRIHAVGICHTDAILHHEYFPTMKPLVLGHEGAGVVVSKGIGVEGIEIGARVCLSYASCGACSNCRSSAPFYCAQFMPVNFLGRRLDGTSALATAGGETVGGHFFGQSSFAEYSVANVRNVVVVPPDTPPEITAPLGCGVQTGAGAVLNVLRPAPGARIGVVGTGAVGLSAVMAARVAGAGAVIAVDTNPARRELAAELGATAVLERVDELDDVDAVIDTTGHPEVLKTIALRLPPRGTLILLGAAPAGTELRFDLLDTLNKGLTLRAVIEGESESKAFIPALLALWREGRFPIDRLVTRYPFDQIDAAFADHHAGRVVKPVLMMLPHSAQGA